MNPKLKEIINKYIPYFVSVLGIILICFFVFKLLNSAEKEIVTYKTKKGQEIYFYIGEKKYEFSSQIVISSDNEIITVKTENYNFDFGSEPIYFKNKNEVLFPNRMSVVFTKNSYIQNKINKLSKIVLDGSLYIQNKNLNYPVNDAFLYDGNDLFFFLNETEIKIGSYSEKLSPFSYAVYNYNKELFMYDYKDDRMIYFPNIEENVLATNKDYVINLGTDSIIHKDGSKLLMKNLDFLNKLGN